MTLAVLGGYFALLLAIGVFAQRAARGSGEDWFTASRSLGPFVLLMTLFGTHMTSFSMLGASGEAYHRGIGVFALLAASSALVVPAVFQYVGLPVWRLGQKHGYVTQVQYFRDRWGSRSLGSALFVALVALLVPYLMIGIKGGGLTIAEASGGAVPEWLGSLLVCAVVLAYVSAGGLRGTAWANTFQTIFFVSLAILAFFVVIRGLGGLDAALDTVAAKKPELLRGDTVPLLEQASYLAIPLSVGMFPHIFLLWLTAKKAETFRPTIVYYPLCIAAVWLPSVLLGVVGAGAVPDLAGPASNGILPRLVAMHSGELMTGLLAAGVLAAGSLDSQILALSSMFTIDIVGRRGKMSDRAEIWWGRAFVLVLLGITYALSLVANRSLFKLGVWSFTGFAALFPLLVAALYWRRSNATGAWVSLLTATALFAFYFQRGFADPAYTVGGIGLLPAAVILPAAALALVVGSLLGRKVEAERVGRFFSP